MLSELRRGKTDSMRQLVDSLSYTVTNLCLAQSIHWAGVCDTPKGVFVSQSGCVWLEVCVQYAGGVYFLCVGGRRCKKSQSYSTCAQTHFTGVLPYSLDFTLSFLKSNDFRRFFFSMLPTSCCSIYFSEIFFSMAVFFLRK